MRKFFGVRRRSGATAARPPHAVLASDTPRQIKRRADELEGLAKSLDEAGLVAAADRVHDAVRLLDEAATLMVETVPQKMGDS